MTLHIDYTHQCGQCEAYYIPFEAAVVCPKCGADEDEVFTAFISEAAHSARFNLQRGSFVPGAWWVGSFADHILRLLFNILEKHREQENALESAGAPVPFEPVARAIVDRIDFGKQEYLREHLYQIALRVRAEMDKTT